METNSKILFIDDEKDFNYALSFRYRELAMTEYPSETQREILIRCRRNLDIAKNYDQAIELLKQNKYEMILFDYHLGDGQKTGLDIALWISNNLDYPFEFYSQSAFEMGRMKMKQVIDLYHQKLKEQKCTIISTHSEH